jgi:hypothetical protein
MYGYSASAMALGGGSAPLLSGLLVARFGTPAPFLMVGALELVLAAWAFVRLGGRSGLHSSLRPAAALDPAVALEPNYEHEQ